MLFVITELLTFCNVPLSFPCTIGSPTPCFLSLPAVSRWLLQLHLRVITAMLLALIYPPVLTCNFLCAQSVNEDPSRPRVQSDLFIPLGFLLFGVADLLVCSNGVFAAFLAPILCWFKHVTFAACLAPILCGFNILIRCYFGG